MEGKQEIRAFRSSISVTVLTLGFHLWGCSLATLHCCKTCQHCTAMVGAAGRCQLRQLDVHPEVADLAVCHHWTPRAPRLPRLPLTNQGEFDRQLELDRALA